MIKYLKRKEIDDKKWNGCVHFAINNFPYGYTWYLDNVAEYWDGLVLDDYQAVFPLVFSEKYSFPYLYQPFFAQQLGLFSLKPITQRLMHEFLEAIPGRFRFVEININFLNQTQHDDYEFWPKTNLVLELKNSYDLLKKNYSNNTKRNLKKAMGSELKFVQGLKPEEVVQFFRNHVGVRIKELKDKHYHSLHRIIYKSMHYNLGKTFGIYNRKNELCSTGFFLYGKNRIINLLPATNEKGKQNGAGFFIIDQIVQQHSGKPLTFDFEGSSIDSIAKFYKGFGASDIGYWQMKRNNLPWFAKILKR